MRTATTQRYIDATKEVREKLAKLFNVTEKMVYLALTYRKNSVIARKIRYVAVREYHCKPMCHCPECETMHNVTEDGRELMVQNFDNGVKLEVDKKTGETVVYDRRGEVLQRKQIHRVPELSEIQLYAESL